jgi:tight adherence protein B
MTISTGLLVLSTAAGVLAVILLASSGPETRTHRGAPNPDLATRGAMCGTIAVIIVGLSGWLLPALVVAAGMWFAVRAWQQRDREGHDIVRTEALASWIENLRDVLIAGDQPVGAITATVATSPAAIRPQVRRLAVGLGRQEPEVVFRRFADEVDDPLGDLVAAGLLTAVQRGARTVAVLTSLADQARQQADRRRLVDAERAPAQREVTLLTIVMGSLVAGLLVFARSDYLQPYETAAGQLFLATVLTTYAALLLRVQRLGVYPRPRRFLTLGDPQAPGAER